MASKRACVLKGGISHEREISLISAKSYENALKNLGYEFISIDTENSFVDIISQIAKFNPDVVVNALHGKFGEDGRIQAVLDYMKIPYTHSGALSSAIAMNKNFTKIIAEKIGIKTPKSELLQSFNDIKFELPFVIKPVDDGSSVGVKLIFNDEDFNNLKESDSNGAFLIEEYIKGKELTVGIINSQPVAVTLINNKRKFYDYTAKYTSNNDASVHVLPAPVEDVYCQKVMQDTKKVYNALNLRGVARADFILSDEDYQLYFLEINTQPGMTPASLVPEQARYKFGWNMDTLVEQIIKAAKYDE